MYTFLSAEYTTPDHSSAIAITREAAAVSLSAKDTPEEWARLEEWGAQNIIAPYTPPVIDLNAIDAAELNRVLLAEPRWSGPGSVLRALVEVMFAEVNKLRVKTGDAAYTKAQFVAALKAKMRA